MNNLYFISDEFAKVLNLSSEKQYNLDEIFESLFIYASKNNLTESNLEYNIYILNDELKNVFGDFNNSLLLKRLKNEIEFSENVSNHPLYQNIDIESKKIALYRLKNSSFINIQNNKKDIIKYLLEKEHLELV